jgi:hypothetical protein
MKNMGVHCRRYDWSSLDMCRHYNWSRLDVYLPMSLSVSCGKNDFARFVASRRPSERYLMALLSCSAFSLLSTNVGKEMPISRIVIVVPNATVVLLD